MGIRNTPSRRAWATLAPLALAVGALAVQAAAWAQAAPSAPQSPQVPLVTARPAAAAGAAELDGTVQAVRQATVAAQAAGSVLQLLVKAGDRVKAGQPIARIDAREAQAGVLRSQAGVAQAEAELRNARIQLDRTRELRQQGFISQSALDVAETQFKAAQAGAQQAVAGRSQATLARDFSTATAPFDGVVLATHLEAGDLAAPGRPIATLYAPGAMRAVVQVPSSRAAAARGAQQVRVQLPDGRQVAPGAQALLPTADPVSQTVEWRLELPAGALTGLMPGQAVRVGFAGTAAPAATPAAGRLAVPAAAVLRRGELTAVYVALDKGFALRAVRLGATVGDSVEVLAGLAAGERIAADAVRAGLAGATPQAAP